MVAVPKHASLKCQDTLSSDALSYIAENLRIRVLYHDHDIVVIEKPCNLRSVPGFTTKKSSTNPDPCLESNQRKRPHPEGKDPSIGERLTASQAWKKAIQSFGERATQTPKDEVDGYIANLGASESLLANVPHKKFKVFLRYLQKNRSRICENDPDSLSVARSDSEKTKMAETNETLEDLAQRMFHRIQERQKPLMNLPESSPHEESAFGQLIMLGYSGETSKGRQPLYVVHRLDCETSGVMVFARTPEAASFLCNAWRERENVSKVYLAKVYDWSSELGQGGESATDGLSKCSAWGRVDLPLCPSDEPLKWKVCSEQTPGAKRSTTLWRLLPTSHSSSAGSQSSSQTVTLELKPITGRTHQLRIHCTTLGGGIVGDSLYGTKRRSLDKVDGERLYLHAHKLSFPHPTTLQPMEFVIRPTWDSAAVVVNDSECSRRAAWSTAGGS
jgi:tRNA pseudouridine32 synthase/23S rRNA pseudouridine746 synthase